MGSEKAKLSKTCWPNPSGGSIVRHLFNDQSILDWEKKNSYYQIVIISVAIGAEH